MMRAYLDHNATSPTHPEVLESMAPWWSVPCNPSSVHRRGQQAAIAVHTAAEQVAALVGVDPSGVVFTSGATEANHSWFASMPRGTVAVAGIEHPCVLAGAGRHQVEFIPVGFDGRAQLDGLPPTDGTSLMAANHETGILQPLEALEARAGWRHVDATAAAGRVPLALQWADAVVLSAHKLGGPMGVGALCLRDPDAFTPFMEGGSQQRGRRAGTIPTPLVVGFGTACAIATREAEQRAEVWSTYADRVRVLLGSLGARVREVASVPSVVHGVFDDVPAETLVQALDLRGICVSAGAACASGSVEASPVLQAMGDPAPKSGVRISMGWNTTHEEIEALEEALPGILEALRFSL